MQPNVPEPLKSRIGDAQIATWGTGNRICLRCCTPPDEYPHDNLYSLEFGVGGVPEYTGLPAQPKPRVGGHHELVELDWWEHRFIISNYPLRG
jgi:hypothetical protein